jgi:hypothetical protein
MMSFSTVDRSDKKRSTILASRQKLRQRRQVRYLSSLVFGCAASLMIR